MPRSFVSRGRRGTAWHSDMENLSFSKLSTPVVMSFCVAGVALGDIRTCLQTCRKSFCVVGAKLLRRYQKIGLHLRGRRSTSVCRVACFCEYHCQGGVKWWQCAKAVAGLACCDMWWHSTLHTVLSTLHNLHFTLYTPHFILYTPHSTVHTPHFTRHTSHTTLYTPHFTLWPFHSMLYTALFTLHTLHFTLHTLLATLHFTLYTPQPSAISAVPATQTAGGCRQVPRLPLETKAHVAKCHACHAKCRGVTGD